MASLVFLCPFSTPLSLSPLSLLETKTPSELPVVWSAHRRTSCLPPKPPSAPQSSGRSAHRYPSEKGQAPGNLIPRGLPDRGRLPTLPLSQYHRRGGV